MNAIRVDFQEFKKLAFDILTLSGVDSKEAEIIAKVVSWTDLIGRSTHGSIRLPIYLKRFRLGLIKSPCRPEFIKKSDAIYILKGKDGFGQYLGHRAMLKAIEIAEKQGIGLVGVQDSNHFGAGAYYIQMAAERHKISLVASNSFPLVAAHGGISPVFGTNPIAFGAPTKNGRSILIDFSTGSLSGSTIRKAIVEQGKLPEGTVIDENENTIEDPKLASKGVMLPFAGARGYCLGFMSEILSGIITGAASSHEIGSIYKDFHRPNKVGHFFLAIDISSILPLDIYFDRMEKLSGTIKNSKKRKDINEILLPGEIRWRNYKRQLKAGIQLTAEIVEALDPLVKELNLSAPW